MVRSRASHAVHNHHVGAGTYGARLRGARPYVRSVLGVQGTEVLGGAQVERFVGEGCVQGVALKDGCEIMLTSWCAEQACCPTRCWPEAPGRGRRARGRPLRLPAPGLGSRPLCGRRHVRIRQHLRMSLLLVLNELALKVLRGWAVSRLRQWHPRRDFVPLDLDGALGDTHKTYRGIG